MKKIIAFSLCALMIFSGCSSWSKLANGSVIGSGAGAALGAAAGALIGKDGKAAAIGAAIGTAVGAGAGAIIGNKMDKKAEELAKIEAAKVDTLLDANGLKAIMVTFDSGILFQTNKAELSDASKKALTTFSEEMMDMQDTDIKIYGHTDNTGTDAINGPLSLQRAESVSNFLKTKGISDARLTAEGKSSTMPVADNSTAAGRAQNRRVEIFISANEDMIKAAEAGELK